MKGEPTILIIGGGEWQVPIVQTAKAMGARVVNTNLYPNSPAFAYADQSFVADVLDYERNLEIAREVQPDAVLTDQSDIAVPTVAFIAQEMGLPGIGHDIALRFTDKRTMRSIGQELGLPTPAYQDVATLEELEQFFEKAKGQIVVKPPASQSSRGVSIVSHHRELAKALQSAQEYSRGASVLAEAFIGGYEITVEGLKLPDRHIVLAISKKSHYQHNPMIAEGLTFTPSDLDFDQQQFDIDHNRFIQAMDLPFGITHTEYKVFEDRVYLIETAARGGGTKISSHIIPSVSGVDANRALVELALGESASWVEPKPQPTSAVLRFFDFQPGTVKTVDGLQAAQSLPGVLDAGVSFEAGTKLLPAADDRSRHLYVITEAPDPATANELARQAASMVQVNYA